MKNINETNEPMLMIVAVIASTPRRLNFLCSVSFDGIPPLFKCNAKVSSGSQMAKEGGELFLIES